MYCIMTQVLEENKLALLTRSGTQQNFEDNAHCNEKLEMQERGYVYILDPLIKGLTPGPLFLHPWLFASYIHRNRILFTNKKLIPTI